MYDAAGVPPGNRTSVVPVNPDPLNVISTPGMAEYALSESMIGATAPGQTVQGFSLTSTRAKLRSSTPSAEAIAA